MKIKKNWILFANVTEHWASFGTIIFLMASFWRRGGVSLSVGQGLDVQLVHRQTTLGHVPNDRKPGHFSDQQLFTTNNFPSLAKNSEDWYTRVIFSWNERCIKDVKCREKKKLGHNYLTTTPKMLPEKKKTNLINQLIKIPHGSSA